MKKKNKILLKRSLKITFFVLYMLSVLFVTDVTIRAEFMPEVAGVDLETRNLDETIEPTQTDNRVRVAVYELPGFVVENEGEYSGYNIEYLSEISKYTGWHYDYVACKDVNQALEFVREGKADIAGGIQMGGYNENGLQFCEYTSGTMYDCIVTMFVNELIYGDYEAFNHITIGCTVNYIHQKEFVEYANGAGYKPRLTYYDSLEEMRNALYEGELDAMLVNSMERLPDNERIIDKFFSKPFYFVTNENRTDLTEELKNAIASIKVNKPDLENTLSKKYFDDTGAFPYTKEELEYLVEAPVIKVGINKDRMPLAYKNIDGKDVGISVDIFNLISGYSGLEFELVDIDDQGVADALKEGKVDLVAGISDENCPQINDSELDWSNAYLNSVAAMVGQKGFEFSGNGNYKIGIVDNNELYISYIKENYPNCEIIEYKDVEEGLKGIVEGDIQGVVENTYVINSMLLRPFYSGLCVVPTVNIAENLRFVCMRNNTPIISIIDKTIASISEDEINTCVLHYTVTTYDYTFKDFVYKYRVQIIIVVPVFIVLICLIVYIKGIKKKAEYDLLKERSQRDVLTKLYNKGAFKNLVETFINDERNKDRKCALIFIDIDNFKSVNDKLGHMVGDETLVKIATHLGECTRDKDIVARFGGDEFCVFAVDMPHSAIKGFAQRANEVLSFGCTSKEEAKKDVVINVSASIGAALYPDSGQTYDELVECADKAVYEVKSAGKNGYKIYNI